AKSKKPRVKQYFADAYSSWQRGTNENINKMIRRFLPKGKSFKGLTNEEVERIERWINNYPRKMFGFKSSNEIYAEYMAA
ncbi:MAG: IS30 family transposase, partial [Bacillota bacterium]|nr:IS30 family transposase [Bacillota bacterium]